MMKCIIYSARNANMMPGMVITIMHSCGVESVNTS